MCFYNDYDSVLVDTRPHVVARKKNAQCCDCLENVSGKEVTLHTFRDQGITGELSNMYECARCKVLREFIYRFERGEGCASYESIAPYGNHCMFDWFADREYNEKDLPAEEKKWKLVWPKTVEEATALRDSIPDPDAAMPPEERYFE